MTGKIYLLQEDGSLQAMSERSYVTEERLQVLLKDYPDLLVMIYLFLSFQMNSRIVKGQKNYSHGLLT